ncbi:MAG TPA: hypothetical protein VLJ21_02205 [Candidatus Binatia bacterium]|nr:hypothetical protein [Candidatus Binatia bacterium]
MRKGFIVGAVVLVAVLALLYFAAIKPALDTPKDPLQINLRDHNNLAMHIHPFLEIIINGKSFPIPANIGITDAGMRVIHTHDSTGKLHVESPYPTSLYLSDFFKIWGKRFDDQCIFDNCKDDTHDLKMYVNGEPSDLYGALLLRDGDRIKIVYGAP